MRLLLLILTLSVAFSIHAAKPGMFGATILEKENYKQRKCVNHATIIRQLLTYEEECKYPKKGCPNIKKIKLQCTA